MNDTAIDTPTRNDQLQRIESNRTITWFQRTAPDEHNNKRTHTGQQQQSREQLTTHTHSPRAREMRQTTVKIERADSNRKRLQPKQSNVVYTYEYDGVMMMMFETAGAFSSADSFPA